MLESVKKMFWRIGLFIKPVWLLSDIIIIIIITLFLFVYFAVLMCFLQCLPVIWLWIYVVIVHNVIAFVYTVLCL
jgi:hypothetical protein